MYTAGMSSTISLAEINLWIEMTAYQSHIKFMRNNHRPKQGDVLAEAKGKQCH